MSKFIFENAENKPFYDLNGFQMEAVFDAMQGRYGVLEERSIDFWMPRSGCSGVFDQVFRVKSEESNKPYCFEAAFKDVEADYTTAGNTDYIELTRARNILRQLAASMEGDK